jgi:hypothetical protein
MFTAKAVAAIPAARFSKVRRETFWNAVEQQ